MQISLKNKNAWVGGATRGLGRAIACQLAESGASVVLVARNEEKLRDTMKDLDQSQDQKHNYLVLDFSNFEALKTKARAYFETNTIDILINNTQGPEPGTVLEKQVEDYQKSFELLFKTNVFISQMALRHMRSNGFGRIINVASLTVKEPKPHLALSNTMRSALMSWSKSLAVEVATEGITVNSILTGYFETERMIEIQKSMAAKVQEGVEKLVKSTLAEIPMKRFGNPKEFASLVCFLASEQASYLTGTQIPLDGGLIKGI